jgi:hypothetical protein
VYGARVCGAGMDGVERLSLVAKVLMDTRMLELKRENEELWLRLFWKDHNPCMLKKAMAAANKVADGPRCNCLACIVGGRCEEGTRGFAPYAFVHQYDEHIIMSPYDRCHLRCQFKPWFEAKIQEAGMSVWASTVFVNGHVVHANDAEDTGQHFSNLGIQDWNTWVYGSRICKASSVGNADLVKLAQLFKTLLAHVCE